MRTIKQLPTGLYSVITNNRVEIYTEKQFDLYYKHQTWWNKIINKYFNK